MRARAATCSLARPLACSPTVCCQRRRSCSTTMLLRGGRPTGDRLLERCRQVALISIAATGALSELARGQISRRAGQFGWRPARVCRAPLECTNDHHSEPPPPPKLWPHDSLGLGSLKRLARLAQSAPSSRRTSFDCGRLSGPPEPRAAHFSRPNRQIAPKPITLGSTKRAIESESERARMAQSARLSTGNLRRRSSSASIQSERAAGGQGRRWAGPRAQKRVGHQIGLPAGRGLLCASASVCVCASECAKARARLASCGQKSIKINRCCRATRMTSVCAPAWGRRASCSGAKYGQWSNRALD